MTVVEKMNLFGDSDGYDISMPLNHNRCKAKDTSVDISSLDSGIVNTGVKIPSFHMPKLRDKRKINADFYDLPAVESLDISSSNRNLYHDLFSKHLAIGTVNSVKDYLVFGACVLRFTDIPKGVNLDVLVEDVVNLLRKTGRNSTVLKDDGDTCVFVQSKSLASNMIENVVQYLREFILTSVKTSDYVNVIVNLSNILHSFGDGTFAKIASECNTRCDQTEKVLLKLQSMKNDIKSYAKSGDSVSLENTFIDATCMYASAVYGDELAGATFYECVSYINSHLPKPLTSADIYKMGVVALVALYYLGKMIKSIQSYQLEGVQ